MSEHPRVCVTGSTHGIGLAIAETFARRGARLVVNSHEPDPGAVAHLSQWGECHFVQADLSRPEGCRTLIGKARERLGGLDTLVCNAGTFADCAFADLDEARFDRTFDLNVKGYAFCAQAFVAGLEAGQAGASIVLVGSSNSLAAERDSVFYDASKGAVLMLVRSLAVTLAARGVRVNGVGPGLVETPLTRPGLDRGRNRELRSAQIPQGRIGEPRDIGGAAAFLASDEARYITGQMLYVDGGILASQMMWDKAT